MATKLNKPVTRETGLEIEGRLIDVRLEPGDRISFKPKGMGEGRRVSLDMRTAYIGAQTLDGGPANPFEPATEPVALPKVADRFYREPDPAPAPTGSTPYRVSGSSIYIGERGPWLTEYGSGIYVSEELLNLRLK